VRRSKAEWIEIVEDFERRGESQEDFCARRHLNVWSFRGWLYRLRGERREGKVAQSATPRMLPIRTRAMRAVPAFVEISVGGVVVRVVAGTDTAYVADLVTQMRERC